MSKQQGTLKGSQRDVRPCSSKARTVVTVQWRSPALSNTMHPNPKLWTSKGLTIPSSPSYPLLEKVSNIVPGVLTSYRIIGATWQFLHPWLSFFRRISGSRAFLSKFGILCLSEYYGGPHLPRQNLLSHGKTYFSTAKLSFPQQNFLFTTAKLSFHHGKTFFSPRQNFSWESKWVTGLHGLLVWF